MLTRASRAGKTGRTGQEPEPHKVGRKTGRGTGSKTGGCIYEYTTNMQIVQGLRTSQTVDQNERVVQAQWYPTEFMNAQNRIIHIQADQNRGIYLSKQGKAEHIRDNVCYNMIKTEIIIPLIVS